jgi:hypothetical protein
VGDRTVVQSVRIDAARSPRSVDVPSTLTGIPPLNTKKAPPSFHWAGLPLF